MARKPINLQHRKFVEEYLFDMNATRAAEAAGYSPKYATVLLRNRAVQEHLAEELERRAQRTRVSSDNVLKEWAAMAFYDAGELARYPIRKPADIATLPEALRRCIVGWSWDRYGNLVLKLADKLAATKMAAMHLGMLRDGAEVGDEPDVVEEIRLVPGVATPPRDTTMH